MKHDILQKLTKYESDGIFVPKFIVLNNKDEYTPISSFLMSADKMYAVRSSFSSEDGVEHSFAGQFETILNVQKSDIKNAVGKVFDSMQNKSVDDYCEAKNISTANLGCVIIQEMIDADYSGVVFTANPQGILNESVVVVGSGVGNNVVEDKIETTTYFYNQDDGIFYFEQNGNSPILEESVFRDIIETSLKIKHILGFDADIEFAIKENKVWILQARPITTLSFENPVILDCSNIIESYPGVALPLTQSFVKTIYYEIFKNCLLRITKDKEYINSIDTELQEMVTVANWRMYYKISNWYSALRLLPCSNKIISIWQKMMGVENKKIVFNENTKPSFKTKIQIVKSFMHYIHKCPEYNEKLDNEFKVLYSTAVKSLNEYNTVDELLKLYDETRLNVLEEWDVTLINDIYTFLYTHLAGEKHKEHICDIKNIESMKPAIAINELVCIARDSGIELDTYDNAFDEYIQEYGDRVLGELKLETQTYRTNPELLDQYVHMSLMNEQFDTISVGNAKEYKGNLFVKRAKIGIKNREISRMNRSRLFGFTRDLFLKIGEIFVKEDRIDNKRDIFYLYIDEIENQTCDYKTLVAYRKKQEQHYNKVPHYGRLVFEKNIINKERNIEEEFLVANNRVLSGIPTSAGVISGEVIVINDVVSNVDTTGKIIVTKSTDPGWVFMIKNCVGIIAEKGSLLSHTAIISRELHKPAIVNVKDCTKILKNGDQITMDAVTGKIEILQKG